MDQQIVAENIIGEARGKLQNLYQQRIIVSFIIDFFRTENEIKQAIAEAVQLDWQKIIGPRRDGLYPTARYLYCYFTKYHLSDYSEQKVAKTVRRDRSMVERNIKQIEGFLQINDPLVSNLVAQIKEALRL